jgi:hypothetical protein
MAGLRLVLILLLSVAGDFAPSSLLEPLESAEEFEEALHRSRGRRPLRLIREVSLPAPVAQAPVVSVLSAARVAGESSRRPPPVGQVRKSPPAVPDSASASDDH